MQITAVVAVYNNVRGLEKTLKSIIEQDDVNSEIIVMDGGSLDGSVDVLRKYDNQLSYWESKRDKGIYHAWNKALERATGDWVCFIGSDDYLWNNHVFMDVTEFVMNCPQEALVYGRVASINDYGQINSILGKSWTYQSIKKHIMPPVAGTFFRCDLFRDHGAFDESFRIAADYDLMLRMVKYHDPKFMPKIIVAAIRDRGVSARIGSFKQIFIEDLKARKNNSICKMNASLLIYYVIMLAQWVKRDLRKMMSS